MLGQTFEPRDLLVIATLVLLEGILSIDNALVLGMLARPLAPKLRTRALSYGLIGAFVFRATAILMAGALLNWRFPKLLGAMYLIYIAFIHFARRRFGDDGTQSGTGSTNTGQTGGQPNAFWRTVLAIELTDLAFAIDSIVAGVALVTSTPKRPDQTLHPKLWLVVTGGMIGVVAMRFTAVLFIKLLDNFPRFETSAYLLVLVIGCKLLLDFCLNSTRIRIDFQSVSSPACWIFWALMATCFALGFLRTSEDAGAKQEL